MDLHSGGNTSCCPPNPAWWLTRNHIFLCTSIRQPLQAAAHLIPLAGICPPPAILPANRIRLLSAEFLLHHNKQESVLPSSAAVRKWHRSIYSSPFSYQGPGSPLH